MKYRIESVIKKLQEAQKKGIDILSEDSLLRFITPNIENIDGVIEKLLKITSQLKEETGSTICSTKFLSEKTNSAPSRQTLQVWKKEGVISFIPHKQKIDVLELVENLKLIKSRK